MRRHSLRGNSAARRSGPDLRGSALVLGVAALVAVGGLTHRAGAGDVVWVGSKSTNFGTAKNWKPEAVPGKTDRVILDTAAGSMNRTITGAAGFTNQAIVVRNGSFSLSAAPGEYTLTQDEGHSVLVGANAGDRASLSLTAGTMSGIAGNLGEVPGSRGTVTVTGDKSKWINPGTNGSGTLVVGDGGKGTLMVQDKGQVMNTVGLMGFSSGSSGSATVTGGGSVWTNSGYLTLGHGGKGTLTVEGGGQVKNTDGFIGVTLGSTGMATVTGLRSKWTNSGQLIVGDGGKGTLMVQDGGLVDNKEGIVGYHYFSVGKATVSGSKWTNSGLLLVGRDGKGTLTVQGGGLVNSDAGFIGVVRGSFGSVTITDRRSTWINSGQLVVGREGRGTLTVQGGGLVTNTAAFAGFIGLNRGSIGTATVTGDKSMWTNPVELYVGYAGKGTLMVQNGGEVTDRKLGGIIGFVPNSNGRVVVTGAGSKWANIGSSLLVGALGRGTLIVQNGGVVTNNSGTLGSIAGSEGTVEVTGSGSKWTNSVDLTAGSAGKGTLTVKDSGTVSVTGTTSIGAGSKVDVNGGTLTTGLLSGAGSVTLNPKGFTALTINDNNPVRSETFSGTISGTANVLKTGASTQIFSGKNTDTGTLFDQSVKPGKVIITKTGSWDGMTKIGGSPGTLVNDGTVIGQTIVNDGGLAKGTGFYGKVDVNAGGTLFPGDGGPGILHVLGGAHLSAGSFFSDDLNGPTAGTGYGQLSVIGGVSLDGTVLAATLNYEPTFRDRLFLIENLNPPASTVLGEFAQACSITLEDIGNGRSYRFQIGYTGDFQTDSITGGHDVVLYNAQSVPEPSAWVLVLIGVGALCAGRALRPPTSHRA
jgi:T5SS/PEP-CTERM-associated repeat protein